MVVINSRDTRRPSPKVGVVPRLLHPRPPVESPGTPTKPTSAAYAEAFLGAILPQISEFVVKIGLTNSVGAISNRSAVTNYLCRILEGQPIAQLFLTNGDRFNFEHGHVEAFYAHDAMEKFPEGGNPADFLGHIHLTTDEAISLCARVMRAMGYTNALPVPTISYALARGTLVCTRYHYFWAHPGEDLPFASFEVDMETKSIKSAFLKDSPFARESPKINVPMEAEEGK